MGTNCSFSHPTTASWKMIVKSWPVAAVIVLGAATSLMVAQRSRPNFSGRWELDKTQSDFGSLPPDDSSLEVIDHREPRLTITQIWKNVEGEHTLVWELTTDGAENINRANDLEIRSRTAWEEGRLVTDWKMKRGTHLTEGRSTRLLSENRQILRVNIRQRSLGGQTAQNLVFLKQSP